MKLINSFLILTVLAFMLLSLGCVNETDASPNTGKLKITTTIFPLYDFAKEVAKDKADVSLLLPPGIEAHTFEPKPSDIIKINDSNIFIYNGAGMDPWAEDIISGTKGTNTVIIQASSMANLLHSDDEQENQEDEQDEETHGEYNPHIWLDFSNDVNIVNFIAQKLGEIDPENKEYYKNNADKYISDLEELDKNYKLQLSDCNHREFITGGHNAFGYLANRYNLKTVSASGLSPDSEPTPQKIKSIIDLTSEQGIKYIYFEEMVNPKTAQTIAQETGAKTLVLTPAENLPKSEFDNNITFFRVMQDNLESLKIGLECN